jgi:nucleoside-diphosphate-sugar epimerase
VTSFSQVSENEARISGKGERIVNMIHRDDLVNVILAALKSGRPGEIYMRWTTNRSRKSISFAGCPETLGKWMPPFATEEENGDRKRGLTNKKVSNRKMKMELGVQLRYPTFRQGYTAEITRLDREGKLHIEPECR